MNELQIKLTADIASFKAAMATVETKLKSAEAILEKASGEADKYRASLASLSAEFKKGSISQEQYDKQVTKLSNGLLKQQDIINNSTLEVNRLSREFNKLGSSSLIANQNKLSQSTSQLGNNITGLANKQVNANGVALEFNRIIQDAPFGIIGVGNNIQQLAGNFSVLSKSAGGTGAALKASFSALATGPNIALLAISALTAGFTAYQMSSRKTTEEVDKLKEAQDALNESFAQTEQLAKAQFYASILKDIGLLKEDFTAFGKVLVDSGLSSEEALQRIADRIKTATKPELEALESFLRLKFQDSTRLATNATTELERQLGKADATKYSQQLQIVTQELEFYSNASDKAKVKTESLNNQLQEFLDKISEISEEDLGDTVSKLFKIDNTDIKDIPIDIKVNPEGLDLPDGIIEGLRKEIASIQKLKDVATDPERIKQYNVQLVELQSQLASFTQEAVKNTSDFSNQLTDVFSQFAAGVVSSLDISNSSLRGFVTTLVAAAPKIIGAIRAISAANKAKSDQAVADGTKEALVGGAVVAVDGAKALGPLGIALLPVFLAGTFALISGFLNRGKAGGGGGGGSASAGVGSTFTNAKPPNVGGFASPARSGVDTSNVSSGFGSMQVDVNIRGVASGYDLAFIVEQASIKKGNS